MTDAAEPALSVLLVQPDVLVRLVFADYLRECGYRVLEASTAAEALAIVTSKAAPVDVVFAQVQNIGPGEAEGFELAREIRRTHPTVDVILSSGIANAADKSHELCEQGVVDKPFEPADLVRRINVLRDRRRRADPG